jgi:phosphatidylserine/phosphatidylglycerophosphate/cardiolipin synthase-like enzyme
MVDADPGTMPPDAPQAGETACDPFVPRAQPPEVLVGPIGFEEPLLDLIRGAQSTVDVLIYEFDRSSFINALIQAKQRGVRVRVLIDPDLQDNVATKNALVSGGVEVRDGPGSFDYYHSKVIIVDGRLAVIMSANLVWAHFEITRNYAVIDRELEDLVDLQRIFDADWQGGLPDLACTRLVVSPVNARTRLLGLINSAEQRLYLATMSLRDEDVIYAVKQRAAAGLDVRILLPDPIWIPESVEMGQDVAGPGVQVKQFKRYDLHAKLVLTEKAAFVGSENLTWTSLNKNREVGIFVTEEASRAEIEAQFSADWSIGFSP